MAGLLAAAVLTGCASPGAAAPPPKPTVVPTPSPTPAGPPSLTDEQLYALAVSQYKKLYAIITEVDRQGGASVLPDASRDVMMDPAWSAYNDFYVQGLLLGDHFVGEPQYNITAITRLSGEEMPRNTAIALQTCELFRGAARVSKDGDIIHDNSPVVQHMKAYFRYDKEDDQLKVFILNSEGVEKCSL